VVLATWLHIGTPQNMKTIGQAILNKISPWDHMGLEFGVLGVVGKLVKHVVHLSKRKEKKFKYFSSHIVLKQQTSSFGLKNF
jgi:hypothetical protein